MDDKISVLILTLNEEVNLPECLESVKWCDDIVVFDSLSTDGTVAIAEAAGARVVQRAFDNWSTHQNWAVENIDFKHQWIFYLDADERCDSLLAKELLQINDSEECSAFQVRRKDYFMGRWLKHAQLYPTWITRVFRKGKIRYERLVNPVAVVEGKTGRLQGHLVHYPFSHGIAHWYDRHNQYSGLEALELLRESSVSLDFWAVFSAKPEVRRRALKELAYKTPGRPLFMLLYLLVVRRGFLDGMPGLNYCVMRSTYEFMIDLKVKELRRREKGLPV